MTMLTGAAVVAGLFGGLWLLTWVVQIAAYAMFALAWLGWLGLRIAFALAGVLLVGWLVVFGSDAEKLDMRRTWRSARAGARLRPA